jgi:hypothetical protein
LSKKFEIMLEGLTKKMEQKKLKKITSPRVPSPSTRGRAPFPECKGRGLSGKRHQPTGYPTGPLSARRPTTSPQNPKCPLFPNRPCASSHSLPAAAKILLPLSACSLLPPHRPRLPRFRLLRPLLPRPTRLRPRPHLLFLPPPPAPFLSLRSCPSTARRSAAGGSRWPTRRPPRAPLPRAGGRAVEEQGLARSAGGPSLPASPSLSGRPHTSSTSTCSQ